MLKVWLAAVIIGVVSFAMVSAGADAGGEKETLINSIQRIKHVSGKIIAGLT